jgi:Txe/YoeB family toxin of Txe-Axe toxin-antitoxin module
MRQGCEEVYAVVVPNLDAFEQGERKDTQKIKDKISKEISRLSENLADYKRIVDFEILETELSKTTSRKIKRKVVSEMVNK